MSGLEILVLVAGGMFALLAGLSVVSHIYSLNNIKNKTVGQGQHGTARWASKTEIKRTYKSVNFNPSKWREKKNLPKFQGIVVGCKSRNFIKIINFIRRCFYKLRIFFLWLFRRKIKLQPPIPFSETKAMVDTGDVHALMIGAAGVGKTAYWLYHSLFYECSAIKFSISFSTNIYETKKKIE